MIIFIIAYLTAESCAGKKKKKGARGQSRASLFETETTDQVEPSSHIRVSQGIVRCRQFAHQKPDFRLRNMAR